MDEYKLSIINDPAISAVYFALLQCGYDFYPIERDAPTVDRLRGFVPPKNGDLSFFSEVRQNTCEVYPYWPRAFMLEAATFYIDLPQADFVGFERYKNKILSAKNISDVEKDEAFWGWISRFPQAIRSVLQSNSFARYLEWEDGWIAEQNERYSTEMGEIRDTLAFCRKRFQSPIQNIQIILNPIKCVYSTDHHINGDTLIYCSGGLSGESLIHEFIHHTVHPAVEKRKEEILRRSPMSLDIDVSYYLDGGASGVLNAFEEYTVRKLTDKIVNGDAPENLGIFFDQEFDL